jgi:1,4-dihydroxy-2-naphthoate octaprenyltransferase
LSKGNNNLQKTYNSSSKSVGGKNMKGFLKKTLGVCLIGLGIGILMVLLLPITGWLIIIGLAVIAVGFIWLAC